MVSSRTRATALLAASVLWAASMLAGAQQKDDKVAQPRIRGVPSVRILPAQPPEPLVPVGPAPDVEILFSCDVQGYYQPCG